MSEQPEECNCGCDCCGCKCSPECCQDIARLIRQVADLVEKNCK